MNMTEHWLDTYAAYHTNRTNRVLHSVCIPLAVVSVVGLLWSLPVPAPFRQSPSILNWGTVFLMATIVYYFLISLRLALGMLPFLVAVIALLNWLQDLSTPLWAICSALLLIASIGMFAGHVAEGHKGSVLRDLHYLMIGPIWLLAEFYKRLHLNY
jgi:uncharacterized membrane protein YGL010W